MIPTFAPKISVILKKVQRREGADRINYLAGSMIESIDLTPFLGEMGGVTTSRGLNQPAGTFQVVLADKMDARSMDTMYASVEAMDMLDIRFARLQQGELPIVMRGLVSHVSRDESMGQDGKPRRTITITGHDYGKFLQIMQVSYLREYIYGNFPLTAFPMFEVYGKWFGDHTASQFVEEIVSSLVDNFIRDVWLNGALKDLPVLLVDATVTGSRVGPFGIPTYEGDIWTLLTNWCDIGWNELFIEDRADAAYVVYRPVPYYDLAGDLIMASEGAVPPDEVEVGIDEVESLSLSRSDGNLANFFQIEAPLAEILNMDWIKIQATQNGLTLVRDNRNCLPEIYGLKKMNARTMQSAESATIEALQAETAAKPVQAVAMGGWYKSRRDQMKRIHQDNVIYEEGQISMRGNEKIKAGMYVMLRRGSRTTRHYVTGVSHSFTPFQSFKTTLQVTRGESYIRRLGDAGSPYQAELHA